MNKNNERIMLIVIGGLIGFLIGYAVFGSDKLPADDTSSKGSKTATSTMESMDGMTSDVSFAAHASDQSAGKQVIVSAETSAPVWVAVRELDAEGKATNILGAYLFSESATTTVNLLRETTPDSSYAISAYEDDGDRIFEFKGDDKILMADDGSDVLATFSTFPTTPR